MKSFIGFICVIVGIVLVVYINVTNPDMTDMRLLMTHWKEYIVFAVLMVLGFKLLNIKSK